MVDAVRYAHVAAVILEQDNWLSLYDAYDEKNYANKPPLLFWILALLFKFLGFSTFTAKFPSALFAITGMFVLWALAKRLYDERVTIFTILALVLSPYFGKDLIDLNFESIAFLGSILCLSSLIHWRLDEKNTWGFAYGLGLLLLLQSKPPYILLILFPTFMWLLFYEKRIPWRFLFASVPFVAIGFSWFLFAGSNYTESAVSNQIDTPFTLTRSYLLNLWEWIIGLLGTFPIPAIFGLYGLCMLNRNKKTNESDIKKRSCEKLLILFALLIIPIIALVDNRPRYLLIPILPLLLLSGSVLSSLFSNISFQNIQKALMISSLVCLILFTFLGIKIHRENALVSFLKSQPEFIESEIPFCINHKKKHRHWSAVRDTELLIHLEFGKDLHIVDSTTISNLNDGIDIVAVKNCFNELEKNSFPMDVLEDYGQGSKRIRLKTRIETTPLDSSSY